jgi:hypothetical protein
MSEIPRGAIRFNTDSNKPELWDGSQWAEFQLSTPNLGQGSDTQPGARGLTGGGSTDSIEYINITSTGSIANFGTLAASNQILSSFGSSTRGYWAGGREGSKVNRIQKVTFASLGDTTDFGDLKNGGRDYPAGCSNSTRGLIAGGYNPSETSNVEYVTMTSTGEGQDFGTLSSGTVVGAGAVSSPTRAIVFGKAGVSVNTIEFLTITTLGNSQDFGDTTTQSGGGSANTNGKRAVLALGNNGANINILNYVTITSAGNATNFGDLTVARRYSASMSSPVRGVFAGGYTNPEGALNINTIDYIEYAAEGNAVDFGDLTTTRGGGAGCSNAHGGL